MTKQDLAVLYDSDFFEWTQHSAELIRQGRLNEADLEHIAEEIEDMGKRDRREVRSRLIVLIAHLLKWQLQPERRTPSWRGTIIEQRQQLDLVFQDSPSLVDLAEHELPLIYTRAARRALAETGLASDRLPPECPYSETEILDSRFLPD
jgi:hypothetical protein